MSGTIVRKVAASDQAVADADTVLDDDLKEQSSVVALGLRRVYAAPLRARGRIAGIVYADSLGADIDDRVLDLAQLDAVIGRSPSPSITAACRFPPPIRAPGSRPSASHAQANGVRVACHRSAPPTPLAPTRPPA